MAGGAGLLCGHAEPHKERRWGRFIPPPPHTGGEMARRARSRVGLGPRALDGTAAALFVVVLGMPEARDSLMCTANTTPRKPERPGLLFLEVPPLLRRYSAKRLFSLWISNIPEALFRRATSDASAGLELPRPRSSPRGVGGGVLCPAIWNGAIPTVALLSRRASAGHAGCGVWRSYYPQTPRLEKSGAVAKAVLASMVLEDGSIR